MRARAPGKVVISGAYSVLDGAPALVAAVDAYAWADGDKRAGLVTDEVAEAIRSAKLAYAPWFDASALRAVGPDRGRADRKLGLGSSAAILVASLGAVLLARGVGASGLADEVFPVALAAHRAAQGGGSGIDVAASCFGGVLRCELGAAQVGLAVEPQALPVGLVFEVWASPEAASTPQMLATLGRFRKARPRRYRALVERAGELASTAAASRELAGIIAALDEQWQTLGELGREAAIPIVTEQTAALGELARGQQACFGPSGAGGGDVALFVGTERSSSAFRARARQAGLWLLGLELGAAGLEPIP